MVGSPPAPAQDPSRPVLDVDCVSCLLVDDEGVALWARRPRLPRANASTTKLATALVVVERADLEDHVTVSQAAAAVPGGRFSLEAGERAAVGELLEGLLVASSNDAAYALAEHVAGSEAAFLNLMHAKAREVGATGSRFASSHGLDAPGHLSTAYDLAALGSATLEDPLLSEIVKSPEAIIETSGRRIRVENTNELLETYRGLVGIKTGYTIEAGNVLVAAAERQGRRLIAVVMGSEEHFTDARRILDHGFKVLARGVILDKDGIVGSLVLDPSGSVDVAPAAVIRGLARPEDVRIQLRPLDTLVPPVGPGERVGKFVVTRDGHVVAETAAVSLGRVYREGGRWGEGVLAALLGVAGRVIPARTR